MKITTILCVLTLLLNCVACALRSRDAEGVSASGLTPQAWASLSRPGPSHKMLEPFVGEWNVDMTFWATPDAKGESSKGTSTISWALGNRFVREEFRGTVADQGFEGLGLMGYDNGSRSFKTVWLDSLNTAMTSASGRYVPESNTFELSSELYDPLLGRAKSVQSRLRFTSADSYVFTMVDESPEGKQFTSLEMVYSRKR